MFRLLNCKSSKGIPHGKFQTFRYINALHEVWMVLTTTSTCRTNCRQKMQYIDTKDSGQWQFLDEQTIFVWMIRLFTKLLVWCNYSSRYACSMSIIPKMNSLNSDLKMKICILSRPYIILIKRKWNERTDSNFNLLERYDILYSLCYPPTDLNSCQDNLNFNYWNSK